MATNESAMGDSCRSAVMAAMEVIEEECGDGRRATQLDGDTVAMMPEEDRRLKQDVDVANADPREVERLFNESEWLDEWTASMCRNAGIPEGSDQFETCKRNFARKALD